MPYDLARLDTDLDLLRASAPVAGPQLVVQRLRIRLATWVGEVLSSATAGLWSEALVVAQRATITAAIVREVETTPGVTRVLTVRDSLDVRTRVYRCSFVALIAGGESVRVTVGPQIPTQPGVPWAVTMEAA